MIGTDKIAGVVTLYNSTFDSLVNIDTYRLQVNKLFVVDNSDTTISPLVGKLKYLPNVTYLPNGGNLGVAVALNRAAKQAMSEGYSYLLTMDDDSHTPPDLITTMLTFLNTYSKKDSVGIVSAAHEQSTSNTLPKSVLTTMTSGNLLNLSIYKQMGPFRNDFFIDHVDHEYCLRLVKAGYQVIELPGLLLGHKLGERKKTGWFGRTYVSHAPVRSYYYIRNGIIVLKIYKNCFPTFHSRLRLLLVKEVLKVLLFEKQKVRRLRFIWQGFIDALCGHLGKLNE